MRHYKMKTKVCLYPVISSLARLQLQVEAIVMEKLITARNVNHHQTLEIYNVQFYPRSLKNDKLELLS